MIANPGPGVPTRGNPPPSPCTIPRGADRRAAAFRGRVLELADLLGRREATADALVRRFLLGGAPAVAAGDLARGSAPRRR